MSLMVIKPVNQRRTPSCHFALPRPLMAAFGALLFTSALCDLFVFWGDELRRRWDEADAVVWGRGWREDSLLLNTMARAHTHTIPIRPCYFLISIIRRKWEVAGSTVRPPTTAPPFITQVVRMRSDTWMHMPLAPNTYECPAFIWRRRNSRATVTVGDGGAVLGGLLLPGHGSTEHFHWKITLGVGAGGHTHSLNLNITHLHIFV